jgi:hypothetical protein
MPTALVAGDSDYRQFGHDVAGTNSSVGGLRCITAAVESWMVGRYSYPPTVAIYISSNAAASLIAARADT